LRDFRRHHHLLMRIHRDLRVVALHKAFPRMVPHDARIRIDEVILPRGLFGIASGPASPLLVLLPLLGVCWQLVPCFLFARPARLARNTVFGSRFQLLLRFFLQFGLRLLNTLQPALRMG
jgi:hypothetical protein